MIEVRCFQNFEELAPLRGEINALNLASVNADPFSTLEFYESYLRHDQLLSESKGFRLCFLAAFDDGCLVGYLPLKLTRFRVFGLRVTKVDFFAVHDIDLPHLVARTDLALPVANAFHGYLFGSDMKWGLLEFQQQTYESLLFQIPFQTAPKGYRIRHWPGWSNWTIQIRWKSLQEYVKEIPKKARSNFSRQMRNLHVAGSLEFIGSSDPAVTPALLELYLGIETYSWKALAALTIGRNSVRIEYFKSLLAAGQPMRISIALLLLDGLPIAGLINGIYGDTLYALQVVFDDRHKLVSPGSAILFLGVREAIVGQYRFFNLLAGFDHFKNRWLAEATETQSTQIYRTSSPLFWRRIFGDLVRSIVLHIRKRSAMFLFPARKIIALPIEDSDASCAVSETRLTTEQRSRIAALIAEVRCGQHQSLSAAELAAAMPFKMPLSGSQVDV